MALDLALGLTSVLLGCTDDGSGGDGPVEDPTVFTIGVEHVAPAHPFFFSGTFGAAPLLPGESYTFEFYAPPGMRLSFATMFVPSNDLFLAPDGEGISLFDDQGQPRSGDVTDQVQIWDAGTEANEDLGLGSDQAPNQSGPNTGAPDPDSSVRPADDANLPAVAELVGVTLTASEGNLFSVTIDNRSDGQTLMRTDGMSMAVPLAPGAFVVHPEPNPLFTAGAAERAAGLEALAEDGDPSELGATLDGQSGVVSPLAPGIWVVHGEGEALFEVGAPDFGLGLESLAEDGSPDALIASYGADAKVGLFGGTYGDEPGPLQPDMAFVFEIEARPGDRLSFASMFAQSNDMFLAPGPEGVELFDADGSPRYGDISAEVSLWDLGTEVDEYPGAGPNQAPRQPGPDTGANEGGVVELAGGDFEVPAATDIVRVVLIEP